MNFPTQVLVKTDILVEKKAWTKKNEATRSPSPWPCALAVARARARYAWLREFASEY